MKPRWAVLSVLCVFAGLQAQPAAPAAAQQAVLMTSKGTIVIDLLADKAPRHVEHFSKLVSSGAMNGRTFHRVIANGIIQGGDPLTRDPAKAAQYGTGGLRKLKAEFSDLPFQAGSVAAVLIPGDRDSAGDQFFICVTDQLQFAGQYTHFGRVTEGLDTVEEISLLEADANQQPKERVLIVEARLRPHQPPPAPAFSDVPVAELASWKVRIATTVGEIVLALHPDRAPETVRHFLRLCEAGVYDSSAFHRIVPGFVVQSGHTPTRSRPLTPRQRRVVGPVKAEFNDLEHGKGTVSMARGASPDSAEDSFFICLGRQPSLDRQYTAFATVVEGLDVIDRIASAERKPDSEEPATRIEIAGVKVEKK